MFQICRGGKERYKVGAFETSASDDENESNKENEPSPAENSSQQLQQDQQKQQQQQQPEVTIPQHPNKVSILLECVGAVGMECIRKSLDEEKTGASIRSLANLTAFTADSEVDPYCIVKLGRRRGETNSSNSSTLSTTTTEEDEIQVHKTQKIKDDSSPIWTIKTDSLCLVELEPDQYLRVQLWCVWSNKRIYAGSIVLDYDTLCHGTGHRCPYALVFQPPDRPTKTTKLFQSPTFFSPPPAHGITLALRYRPATRQDYMLLKDIPDPTSEKRHSPNHAGQNNSSSSSSLLDHADDLDFKHVAPKHQFLTRRTKTVSLTDTEQHHGDNPDPAAQNGNEIQTQERSAVVVEGAKSSTKVKLYRVWPGPDPERVQETKFLSKRQLQLESEKPSRHWVEAGSGDYATVYLEILSCDDLPNMVCQW
jgi:hypothetical protein